MTDKNTSSQKTARKWSKRLVLLALGLAVVAAIALAAAPKPVAVEIGRVEAGTLVVTVNEDGRARVKDRFVISAPLSGNLARIELHPGDPVKQGDVLARLVPVRAPLLDARSRSEAEARVSAAYAGVRQAKAQIARAEAASTFTRTEVERVQALVKGQVIGREELDRVLFDQRTRDAELTSAQFGAKVAGHQLTMAQAALGHLDGTEPSNGPTLTVTSPISGRILRVIQESEGVVAAGTQLVELGDPRALELVVDVLTGDAVSIHSGSAVTVDGWGGKPLPAVVRLVEPSAFTRVSALGIDEQRVNAIIDLTAPYEDWQALGDGYRVEARIEVFRADNAVLVPQSSLFRLRDAWALYEVVEGRAERRIVEIGRRNDIHAQVLKGIAPGAEVVMHPSDKVTDQVALARLQD